MHNLNNDPAIRRTMAAQRGRAATRLIKLAPSALKTYAVQSTIPTHFRRVSCEEFGCKHWRNGFQVHVERLTPKQLTGIKNSHKKYKERKVSEGFTYLDFPPGQSCFDGDAGRHLSPLARPPLYVVRGGDWRGNPRGENRTHTTPDFWAEDYYEHKAKLDDAFNRG